MDKRVLEQYRSICAEIIECEAELNEDSVFSKVQGSDAEFPYTQHSIKVSGIQPTKDNFNNLLKIQKLKLQKKAVEDFIDNIPDSLIRRIFKYRYIKGSTYRNKLPSFQKIAFDVGESDESFVRRKHDKYLKLAEFAENNVL